METTKINITSVLCEKEYQKAENKIWIVKSVPLFAEGVNDNNFEFLKEDIEKSYQTMEGKPIVANISGFEDTDHATKSVLDTVGHVYNLKKELDDDGKLIVLGDLEVTNPLVGEKLERKDTKGVPEINGVSMGVNTECTCSICGAYMYDSSCENGHIRGEIYDGKKCTAQGNNSEFEHLALTNMPAEKKSYFKGDQVFFITASYNKKGDIMKKKEIAQDTEENKEKLQEIVDEEKVDLVSDKTKEEKQDDIVLNLQKQIAEQELMIEELKKELEEIKNAKTETSKIEENILSYKFNIGDEIIYNDKNGIIKGYEDGLYLINLEGSEEELKVSEEELKTKEIVQEIINMEEISKLKRENSVLRAKLQFKENAEKILLQKELEKMGIEYKSNDLHSLQVAVKVAKEAKKQSIVSRQEKYFGKNNESKNTIPKYVMPEQKNNKEIATKAIEEKGAAFALKEAYEKKR
jgi:hypothetical protein